MQSNSVIDRLLDILLLFKEGKESWSIDDIATMLDLPKSTCYRLVRALQERGFLEKSGTSSYQLGITFMRLSSVALSSNRDIRLMALPSMKRIADTAKESVSLMRLMNRQVVCVESIEGQYSLRVSMQQGRIQPLHAGASHGCCWRTFPKKTGGNISNSRFSASPKPPLPTLKRSAKTCSAVRHLGYAISDGEIEVGPKAIAVPLMKNRNEVIAALSIEAPRSRMTDEIVSDYVALLQREAALIQQEHR